MLGVSAYKKKKQVVVHGKKVQLYPQDIILSKTLLRLVPDYIMPTYFSIARIIFTPLAAYLIVYGKNLWMALVIYLLVSFTDTVDGALARTRNQITELGKVLDPIADKLLFLVSGALILPKFGATNLLIIILTMEGFAILLGYFFFRHKAEMSANIYGKVKLVFQILGIVLFIIANYGGGEVWIEMGKLILICSIYLHACSLLKFLLNTWK